MSSILEQLATAGAMSGPEEFVDTEFEWKPPKGGSFKFEISVKKELTAADFEYINFGGANPQDPSYMSRRVVRLVRFRSIAGEKCKNQTLILEDARRMLPELLLQIVTTINNVESSLGKEGAETSPS